MAAFPFISFTAVQEKALWLFGVYQGLCLSVINLIPSFSAAIGASGLPVISLAVAQGNTGLVRRQTSRLVKLTALCVVPVSLFVMFFSSDVLITLYGNNGAQTTLAAYFLKIMAPVAILSAFSFPLNAIMHSRGKSSTIFRILLVACGAKMVLSARLCSLGSVNIMGCVISQMVFHIIVFALSVRAVASYCPPSGLFRAMAVPAVVAYILLTFVRILADFVLYSLPCAFRTVLCGGLFIAVYGLVMVFASPLIDKG